MYIHKLKVFNNIKAELSILDLADINNSAITNLPPINFQSIMGPMLHRINPRAKRPPIKRPILKHSLMPLPLNNHLLSSNNLTIPMHPVICDVPGKCETVVDKDAAFYGIVVVELALE
jgi:hypothetical protein